MSTYPSLIYEKNLDSSLCHVDVIQLNEYNNYGNDDSYIYSGITIALSFTGFTSHFNTTGHTYSNVILNNDVYTYTGPINEIHYFTIYNFYSGGTPTIDPLLTGLTEANIISGFSTSIISCYDKLDGLTGTCCPTQAVLSNLPWVVITNEGGGTDNCSDYITRRTEKGWTLDFVFNKNGLTGWTDCVFFYMGVRDEYDPENYADNNLSFKFTDDGRIKWSAYRYSGYCDTVSGYTPIYYISTGQTMPLCSGGTSNDFNITISFERYYYYTDCEIDNEGGYNDLIITGTTEELNNHWRRERDRRLGILKIYHNGRPLEIDDAHSSISNFRNVPVFKFKNWEEVILSDRGFQPFVHSVGGGVSGSGDLHNSVFCYMIKYATYFEDVVGFPDVYDRYINATKLNYNIIECNDGCTDDVVMRTPSITPSTTLSITPSITPSITVSRTPTITPTVSCARPFGLTEYNFLSMYNGPPITLFKSSFNSACDALSLYDSVPFYGQTGYTLNLITGNPVYYPVGTDCGLLDSGYYIIYTGDTPFIVYVNDGYVNNFPLCPSLTPSITPTLSITPSKTPSIIPSETPTPTPSA